jgi:subtilisin family serine protease
MLPISLLFAATSAHAEVLPISVGGILCHPRNVMVRVSGPETLEKLENTGGRVVRYMPEIHWAVVESPVGHLVSTRSALSKVPGVESTTLDRAGRIAYTPNDPKWIDQWHMPAIKVDKAWDISLGSSSVIVAVLDTGVQVTHPDLAANVWVNAAEIPGNSIDDDGNGYVDDVNGYDFAFNDGNPDDDNGHGTACAGIVAGVGDNGIGVSGVAPQARIMAIKNANSSGYFFDSYTVPSYIYAANMGAKVFSMSYYADSVSQAEEDALTYAVGKGVLPIAAAGNDSTVYPFYPGAYENVLSVAAVDNNLNKAGFSDWGSWVDVAAPGTNLTTTAKGDTYTNGFGGTSGACPHVAGLAGLLLGANPATPPAKLRRTIEDTATPVNQAPFGQYANYGLINAEAAMKAITGRQAPAKPAVVRWISPIGIAGFKTANVKVYGRTMNNAQVFVGGTAMTMKQRSRDSTQFTLPTTGGTYEVKVGGVTIASYDPPVPDGFVYPLIEASTKSATLEGGFAEALNDDTAQIRVTRRSDGLVLMEASFKNLPRSGKVTLLVKRRMLNSTAGTEQVQLYNWAGGSYPYSSFTTLATRSVTDSSTVTSRIVIDNIAPYVDFEGTAYLRILADGQPSGAELRLNQAYIQRGAHP